MDTEKLVKDGQEKLKGFLRRYFTYKNIITVGIWFSVAIVIYFIFFAVYFQSLNMTEALDMAQLARNIYEGRGFTTYFIRPVSFFFNSKGLFNQPDLFNAPLYPLILSILFSLLHVSDRVVAFGSGIFFLVTAPFVFYLARRILNKTAAYLALVLFLTNGVLLKLSISGLSYSFLGLLLVILILVLLAVEDQKAKLITSGVIVALCYLTRYDAGMLILPVLIYVNIFEPGRNRLMSNVYLVASFGVVVLPWLVRNTIVVGNPFFSVSHFHFKMFTPVFPDHRLLRIAGGSVPLFVSVPLSMLLGKFVSNIVSGYQSIILLTGNFVSAFFYASFLTRLPGTRKLRLRFLVLSMMVIHIMVIALSGEGIGVISIFIPLAIVFGSVFFVQLLERLNLSDKKMGIAILCVFVALNLIPLFGIRKSEDVYNEKTFWLARQALGGKPVITDIPWYAAWYGDTPSIWLPWSMQDYAKIYNAFNDVQSVLLTPGTLRTQERFDSGPLSWKNIYMTGELPEGFYHKKGLKLPNRSVLLLDNQGALRIARGRAAK